MLELTRTPTNWLLWNCCPALTKWSTNGRGAKLSYFTKLAQRLQQKDGKKKWRKNSFIPHSLHSALIRSQTARENKSMKHISCPTLNNLECKNETVTMSSWVCFYSFSIISFVLHKNWFHWTGLQPLNVIQVLCWKKMRSLLSEKKMF